MATSFIFNGKKAELPGIYSTIKSGIKNAPLALDYGKVLIIDTGSGATWGFGSGVLGTLKTGADSIYYGIKDLGDMRELMKGGLWWKLAEPLFSPDGAKSIGVSEIEFARAAETVPATIDYTFTNGSLEITLLDEGVIGNGVSVNSNTLLTKGYAGVFGAGTDNPTKYVWRLLRGTYRGMDTINSVPWNGVLNTATTPDVLLESPEVSTVAQLVTWMTSNSAFNAICKLTASTATGAFVAGDIVSQGGLKLAAGGTENYTSAALDLILDNIVEDDYSIILADKYGLNADHTYNARLQYHINNEAKFEKMLVVGGGNDGTQFAQSPGSVEYAEFFNDESVTLVHGGVLLADKYVPSGFRILDSIYKAAAVVGRLAGLPPQVPIGFKGLKFSGERHKLTVKEQKVALAAGVLYTGWDNDLQRFAVAQGINTLLENENFINEDGTSSSIQIKRIKAQLNKEIIVNAKKQLFGNPNGVNSNTLSEQTIKDWLNGYLKLKVAVPISDNLILDYQNVTAEKKQDSWFVSYEFKPNGEITKMFFTGFMID